MQFEPEQLEQVKAIFDDITSQEWFDPAEKEVFAKYLIDTYPIGAFDAKRHRSVVETSARMFYARQSPTAHFLRSGGWL